MTVLQITFTVFYNINKQAITYKEKRRANHILMANHLQCSWRSSTSDFGVAVRARATITFVS